MRPGNSVPPCTRCGRGNLPQSSLPDLDDAALSGSELQLEFGERPVVEHVAQLLPGGNDRLDRSAAAGARGDAAEEIDGVLCSEDFALHVAGGFDRLRPLRQRLPGDDGRSDSAEAFDRVQYAGPQLGALRVGLGVDEVAIGEVEDSARPPDDRHHEVVLVVVERTGNRIPEIDLTEDVNDPFVRTDFELDQFRQRFAGNADHDGVHTVGEFRLRVLVSPPLAAGIALFDQIVGFPDQQERCVANQPHFIDVPGDDGGVILVKVLPGGKQAGLPAVLRHLVRDRHHHINTEFLRIIKQLAVVFEILRVELLRVEFAADGRIAGAVRVDHVESFRRQFANVEFPADSGVDADREKRFAVRRFQNDRPPEIDPLRQFADPLNGDDFTLKHRIVGPVEHFGDQRRFSLRNQAHRN